MKRSFFMALVTAASLAAAMGPVLAQGSYPSRPVHLIVPFPAGGIADIVGREVAERLALGLGQPVLVENKLGAGGAIGTEAVAKSRPDGYTLLLASSGHTILPAFSRSLPWDPVRDFTPVALIGEVAHVLTVPSSLKVGTLAEFTQLAKANPGKLNYGSSGNGSLLHLATEHYKLLTGVDIRHVPYKGQPQALADLIEGRLAFMPLAVGIAAPHVKSGKLRALAVASGKRTSVMPDVPSATESGVGQLEASAWFAILAPAGTDSQIVRRVSTELKRVTGSPEFEQKLKNVGGDVRFADTTDTADFIKSEVSKWQQVIRSAGIKTD